MPNNSFKPTAGVGLVYFQLPSAGAGSIQVLGLMPYFRVRLEGKDISVPMGDSTAVGFFTTRAVRARSSEEAVEKARSMINAAWTTGKYAAWNKGTAPTIHVEDVWFSPWYKNVLFKNDGHVFYPDEEGDEAKQFIQADAASRRGLTQALGTMIFAVATDEKTLMVFASTEKAIAYCEGIDVEDGGWLYWDESGTPLAPEFLTPNYRRRFTVGTGTYRLASAPFNRSLAETIAELNHLEINPYFASCSAVLAHRATTARKSQHGAIESHAK